MFDGEDSTVLHIGCRIHYRRCEQPMQQTIKLQLLTEPFTLYKKKTGYGTSTDNRVATLRLQPFIFLRESQRQTFVFPKKNSNLRSL